MSKPTEKQAEPFSWLSRENRGMLRMNSYALLGGFSLVLNCPGPTYISFSPFYHRTASPFEFGDNGYAGCCNYGGDLIHLAARSRKHGIVCVRGYRSTSLYGTLAQTQGEFGGPSSFGLEVSASKPPYKSSEETAASEGAELPSSFRPGKLIERGCLNYRWPLYEYALLRNNAGTEDDKMNDCDTIDGSSLSGISSNTTLGSEEDGRATDNPDTPAGTYTVFSLVKGGVFYQVLRLEQDTALDVKSPNARRIVLTVGGNMWFRTFHEAAAMREEIVNQQPRDGPLLSGKRPEIPPSDDPYRVTVVHTVSSRDQLKMEMEVSLVNQDGSLERLELTRSDNEMDTDPKSVPAYNTYKDIPCEQSVTTFVAAFRLSEYSEDDERTDDDKARLLQDKLIKSKEIPDYVAADMYHPNAIGDMWLTIFVGEEQQRLDYGSLLTGANLVGRCLERILQVEMFPVGKDQRQLALVSNLFMWPNVDLKALLYV